MKPVALLLLCGTLLSGLLSVGGYAYKDFLWHDATVPRGNLKEFRLSHFSTGQP